MTSLHYKSKQDPSNLQKSVNQTVGILLLQFFTHTSFLDHISHQTNSYRHHPTNKICSRGCIFLSSTYYFCGRLSKSVMITCHFFDWTSQKQPLTIWTIEWIVCVEALMYHLSIIWAFSFVINQMDMSGQFEFQDCMTPSQLYPHYSTVSLKSSLGFHKTFCDFKHHCNADTWAGTQWPCDMVVVRFHQTVRFTWNEWNYKDMKKSGFWEACQLLKTP